MNPRQRRGVLITIAALAAAGAAFVAVTDYTSEVARQLGPQRPVLRLLHDVPAWTPLRADDVEVIKVPEKFAASSAVRSVEDLDGRVAAARLRAGGYLQTDHLAEPPQARPDQREISLLVDIEASVAGAVGPDSFVDLVAVRDGSDRKTPTTATLAASAIRVVRVLPGGRTPPRPDSDKPELDSSDESGNGGDRTSLVVTFAVSPAQANAIVLADATAKSVRLALIPQGGTAR